jgi:hypothetical protein
VRIERSRSREAKSEAKSEPEIKVEPVSPPRARGRPKSGSAKRDYVEVVKDEVENIEQRKPRARTRTPTKETPKKTPKKDDNEPESKPEPKGKPGRPRSVSVKPGAASSSSNPRTASFSASYGSARRLAPPFAYSSRAKRR